MEDYDERTRKQLQDMFYRKHENAKVIKNQLFEFKMNTVKKVKDEMLEGELIKRKAKQDLMEEQRKQQELRQQQARQREQFKQANEELKAYNEELKRKEAAELLRIEDYAVKKERME